MRIVAATLMLTVVLMSTGCPPSSDSLEDVWGSSSSDVFAVGWSGNILHYDGNEWSKMASGTAEVLNAVWGSSSSDIFVVGRYETILHYDGHTWSLMTGWSTPEE